MKHGINDWIEKAEGDWRTAQLLHRAAPPACDAACYHAQQAAEKWIKAVLHDRGKVFPKTHDLIVLIELAAPALRELINHRRALEQLSTVAVEVRYPGFDADAALADAALATARTTRDACRRELGFEPE